MQYVFLSHDVDWRRQGAPHDHILARRERFEQSAIKNLRFKNPYYNIPEYIEIEEKFDVKSTFFFRTIYENGDFRDYHNDITILLKGNWEIGLHLDPSSINDINRISEEKSKLEEITKTNIKGNRVHYLGFNKDLPIKLKKLGFVYDSSTRKSKDQINENEMGYTIVDGLIEFPVTLMDAYMFTYMKISEQQVVSTFKKTLEYSRKLKQEDNIITVIWHDNVLKMKGGRMYSKILEFLSSQEDVKICKGIELALMVK